MSGSEQPTDLSLFGEHPPSGGRRRRGDWKRFKSKKAVTTSPTRSTDMRSYSVDIGLDVEEPMAEVPPLTKKKKAGPQKRRVYKYLRAQKIFANLSALHSMGEAQELLATVVEFLTWGWCR